MDGDQNGGKATRGANGKTAIVTGTASGIGRAIAERLVEDGANVLAVDLRPADDGPGEPRQPVPRFRTIQARPMDLPADEVAG